MMNTTTQPRVITASTVYPSGFSEALRDALKWADPAARIDAITDQMAVQGIVRKREDFSRLGEWVRQRDNARHAEIMKGLNP